MATAIAIPENQAENAPGEESFPASALPWRRAVLRSALLAAIASVLITGYLGQTRLDADAAAATEVSRQRASATLDAQRAAGVDEALLAPVANRISRISAAHRPQRFMYWDPSVEFEAGQRAQYDLVLADLATLPSAVAATRQAQVTAATVAVRVAATQWPTAGGDPAEIAKLVADATQLSADSARTTDLHALAAAVARAEELRVSITTALAQQQADHDAQARYATEELAAAGADFNASHTRAADLGYNASGDGEVAVRYHVPTAELLVARITRHGADAATASNPAALADALAWLRVDKGRLETAMATSMPEKAIYVSLAREELRAYDHGKPFITTFVTTGRPELGTDTGEMSVIRKDHPWTMHSPWPRGSRFWYPDTRVNYVLWFHEDGSGLHDAPWRSHYGPGTNDSNGTHGCVNIPFAETVQLFNWAPVGTPVYIY
jgi:hypothetical protein